MTLELDVVTEPENLATQSAAWWDLLARSDTASPSMTPTWLLAWWHAFGGSDGRRLRVAILRSDGRWVGLLPCVSRRVWHRPGLPFRRLELMGSGEPEADEVCSDYLGIVAERGLERPVCQRLADAVYAGKLGDWDELVMPAMDGEAMASTLFSAALHGRKLEVACDTRHEAPYIPLPATWDAYLAALSSQRRYLVRRSLRDFESWAGGELCFEVAATPAELERGYGILQALHEQRWREEGHAGVFQSARFRAFHERVMPELLARGELELAWLCVRGEPVAAVYNIIYDGNVYFYQSGRKTDVPKQVRPGLVMHAYAIRRSIELRRKTYDFLAGASRYKRDLALASRPLMELRAVRPTALEALRRIVERGVGQARALRAAWQGTPA